MGWTTFLDPVTGSTRNAVNLSSGQWWEYFPVSASWGEAKVDTWMYVYSVYIFDVKIKLQWCPYFAETFHSTNTCISHHMRASHPSLRSKSRSSMWYIVSFPAPFTSCGTWSCLLVPTSCNTPSLRFHQGCPTLYQLGFWQFAIPPSHTHSCVCAYVCVCWCDT